VGITNETTEKVTVDELAGWVRDAAQRLTDLVADLDDEQLIGPWLAIINPLLWEIGHVTWLQESFVLRRALIEPPIIGHADAIWDSGAIPHDTSLRLPSREETLHYIAEVTDRVAARLNRPEATAQLRYITRYAVHHHDMHTEALTYTRQTLGYPPPVLPGIDVVVGSEAGGLPGDAEVPGGRFPLGGDRDRDSSTTMRHGCTRWSSSRSRSPARRSRSPSMHASLTTVGTPGASCGLTRARRGVAAAPRTCPCTGSAAPVAGNAGTSTAGCRWKRTDRSATCAITEPTRTAAGRGGGCPPRRNGRLRPSVSPTARVG